MNYLYNPLFLGKTLKSYLCDIKRLYRFSEEKLSTFQNIHLQQMVRFAQSVPMYHDLYTKSHVDFSSFSGVSDLQKLPIVSKTEITQQYPNGIISQKVDKKKLIEVSTSGTSGKKLSMFIDPFDIVIGLFGYLRTFVEYTINWRKDRITIIGDFTPHTAETGYVHRGILQGSPFLFKNFQWLNTNDPPQKIMEQLIQFKPRFLGGYAGMLGHLALLKDKGFGKLVCPKVIASTGSVLDPGLKQFIEQVFETRVFEAYGSTESGPIGFQCQKGSFHVMSDLVHLEFIRDGRPAQSGEPSHVILSKLYGKGTPFLRYSSVNDIVSPLKKKCSCGMAGDLIEKIYGRDDLCLYLSNGRVLLPSSIANVYSKVLYELKTNKVKETRVIQHTINSIEIQMVLDPESSDDVSADEICSVIYTGFKEKIGKKVDLKVEIVKKIESTGPRIVTQVDTKNFVIKEYL